MDIVIIVVFSLWYTVTIHHVQKHHNKHKFKIVATLILLKDGYMKISFKAPSPVAGIVKQTLAFTGAEPASVSVDLLPQADGTLLGVTGVLTGVYTVGQQVAATLTQTDAIGTVSPATPFDFTLVGDVVAAPDASGVVATLQP